MLNADTIEKTAALYLVAQTFPQVAVDAKHCQQMVDRAYETWRQTSKSEAISNAVPTHGKTCRYAPIASTFPAERQELQARTERWWRTGTTFTTEQLAERKKLALRSQYEVESIGLHRQDNLPTEQEYSYALCMALRIFDLNRIALPELGEDDSRETKEMRQVLEVGYGL